MNNLSSITRNMANKSFYYAHSIASRNIYIDRDHKYKMRYDKVIQINVNTFSMYPNMDVASQVFTLFDVPNSLTFKWDLFEVHYIDIVKCLELWYTLGKEKVDTLTKWGALIASKDEKELLEIVGDDTFMSKCEREEFYDFLEKLKNDPYFLQRPSEEEEYRANMDEILENKDEELVSKDEEITVMKEELASKDEKLVLKDEEITVMKEELASKNKETALKMLNEGLDVEIISKVTGLSQEEINSFKS